MMKRDRVTELEKALVASHRNRPQVETPTGWDMQVMQQIQAQGGERIKEQESFLTQRFVWRFAAVACTIALGVSMYAIGTDLGPEHLVAKLFFDDPLGLVNIPIFAL